MSKSALEKFGRKSYNKNLVISNEREGKTMEMALLLREGEAENFLKNLVCRGGA